MRNKWSDDGQRWAHKEHGLIGVTTMSQQLSMPGRGEQTQHVEASGQMTYPPNHDALETGRGTINSHPWTVCKPGLSERNQDIWSTYRGLREEKGGRMGDRERERERTGMKERL